jgi:hypothetical protein
VPERQGPAIRTIIGLAEFAVMNGFCEIYTKSAREGERGMDKQTGRRKHAGIP